MKASRYNVFVKDKENILAFNCLSGAFAKIDKELYERYLQITSKDPGIDESDPEVFAFMEDLKKGGFLIEDDLDELELIRAMHYLGRFALREIQLTIAPTMECNFSCTYCYEKSRKNVYMSRVIEDRILEYVDNNAVPGTSLKIIWFGGEPTLALDTVYRVSEELLKIATEKNLNYVPFMVTNGYLLTKEVALQLKKYHFTGIQFTIDGPPGVHNRRRPLKNGNGTFDTIIENMKEVANILSVSLRVNMDTDNLNEFEELMDILVEVDMPKSVSIGPSRVEAYTGACQSVSDAVIDVRKFAILFTRLFPIIAERGFKLSRFPKPNLKNCSVIYRNDMLITPEGNVYRCWNTVEDERECIGNISQPKLLHHNLSKWLAWDPLEEEKCRKCKVLPMCMGGCPHAQLGVETYVKSSNRCSPWKYNLPDMIRLMYRYRAMLRKNAHINE